jgi:hypothetical protein
MGAGRQIDKSIKDVFLILGGLKNKISDDI